MAEFKIKAELRNIFGKNACRRIRKEGKLPAILYGDNTENVPLILNQNDILRILKSETGENTIFKIAFNSQAMDVMIKDLQKDPIYHNVIHVDLYRIALDKTIQVSVPIVLTGEAVGVKSEGGFIDFVTREIEIECLPQNIPEHIEVDISSLHINQSLKVGDIKVPEGIKILEEPNVLLVHIEMSEEEEIVEEEKEERVFAGETEEPEVIKKEKEKPEPEEKKEEEG
ncbi:MAG: 50S ribosomal protein L25 [Candidatus Aminicenantia bacterium]